MTQPYLSQRILTFFALGGVSIAVVAFWFYEHRRKTNRSLEEAKPIDMAVKDDETVAVKKTEQVEEQQSYAVSDTEASDIEDTEQTQAMTPPKPSVPEVKETLAVSTEVLPEVP